MATRDPDTVFYRLCSFMFRKRGDIWKETWLRRRHVVKSHPFHQLVEERSRVI